MSTVAPIEDVDLSWVDLDEELPCSWVGCETEAAWKVRCKRCGMAPLMCDAHERFCESHEGFVECERCHHLGFTFRAVFDPIPI